MANPDKFLRLRDYARLERAQKNGVVDGTKFNYDSAKHVVSNVREYFDAHRDGRTYGVRFPLYSFSNSPDGVKVGDNAGLTVVPSTNYRAGRDDYAGLSAFRVFDANVAVADDGTPVVKAIKGLAGNYAKDGSNGDVFVITTPGFYRFEFDTNYCTIWYSDTQYDGYSPMPGALLPDGSLRPCMAYAKYPLSNYGGKAASVSGQIPTSMSEQGSVAITTSKGKGYSGKTSADTFYMQLMHMLKYATKDIERHLGGDFNGPVRSTSARPKPTSPARWSRPLTRQASTSAPTSALVRAPTVETIRPARRRHTARSSARPAWTRQPPRSTCPARPSRPRRPCMSPKCRT